MTQEQKNRNELELSVDNKTIKFIVERGYCFVYFTENGKTIKLGEDSLSTIVSKLFLSFIDAKSRKYVVYQGIEFFTIFNLMGPHVTIAGRDFRADGLELLFLEDGGKITPLVCLTMDDIKDWVNELVVFMIQCDGR